MLHRRNRKQLIDLEQLKYAQNLYETHKMWSAMMAIMAIKWLSPASQLHSILGLVSGGLTICIIYGGWNGSNSALYIYGFLPVIFTIDCTLHPILCVRYSRTLQRSLTKMFPDKGKVFHTLIRRVLLGSTKIENDANDNNLPVVVVSINNYAPKVTRIGEVCERVIIKHNISPEKQQEILINAWNMVASKKEKNVEEVPKDDDRKIDS
uniref:Uncharacterized protein n=1 Tax=Romanomermis culicivorax TaxID=13658 RepID=A0A915LA96_ROMCU